ncbi:MAG: hypothetical protein R3B06_30165 [Kofleriaceae bacterium]
MSIDATTAVAALADTFDRLVAAGTRDQAAVLAARQRYEERRGKVFEDEPLWETWSSSFVEWFVLESVPVGRSAPAAADALAAARAAGDDAAAALISAWLTSHRSLWSVERLGDGWVELLDLLGGAHVRVTEPRQLHGVAIGEVAEVRVIGHADRVWFGRAFVFHPRGTRDALLEQARQITAAGGDRRAILDTAAALRVRLLRYRHVAPAKLYQRGLTEKGDR